MSFRESCDVHLNVLNVLSRIDDVCTAVHSHSQLYHLKQLCSLEQTICSSWLPSGGQLMLDEIIPMVQRMLIDTTLGEQEKLRLLLISLFSYPYLLGTQQWSALVHSAALRATESVHALAAAELVLG